MYVNSKTKRTERIGDLKVKNEQDETVICTSAKSKADSLCSSFSSVFCNETDDDFEPIRDRTCFQECTPVIVTEEDVLARLNRLNINNKSEGSDLIHPRVIYEIRHKITHPLTMLFNRSLEKKQIPDIWKCANISPIYNKNSSGGEIANVLVNDNIAHT